MSRRRTSSPATRSGASSAVPAQHACPQACSSQGRRGRGPGPTRTRPASAGRRLGGGWSPHAEVERPPRSSR
eukprot:scaffold17022_cov105-Isochrysis_galbana.AAC.1